MRTCENCGAPMVSDGRLCPSCLEDYSIRLIRGAEEITGTSWESLSNLDRYYELKYMKIAINHLMEGGKK